ncbi:uncharacterized protein [Littorina saxatilis]|uniref:uncharacterized protein n=1 Tax=Littorina saxatilis TaxID=31220 RepID=UPI0038B5E6BF
MQLSGHKNVQSINNYSSISQEEHRGFSLMLNGTAPVSELSPVSADDTLVSPASATSTPAVSTATATITSQQRLTTLFAGPVHVGSLNYSPRLVLKCLGLRCTKRKWVPPKRVRTQGGVLFVELTTNLNVNQSNTAVGFQRSVTFLCNSALQTKSIFAAQGSEAGCTDQELNLLFTCIIPYNVQFFNAIGVDSSTCDRDLINGDLCTSFAKIVTCVNSKQVSDVSCRPHAVGQINPRMAIPCKVEDFEAVCTSSPAINRADEAPQPINKKKRAYTGT